MLPSQAACRERLLERKLPLHNSEAFMGPLGFHQLPHWWLCKVLLQMAVSFPTRQLGVLCEVKVASSRRATGSVKHTVHEEGPTSSLMLS